MQKIGRINICIIISLGIAAIFMFAAPLDSTYAQDTRDFALPEGVITDFTRILTESQMDEIRWALQDSYEKNGMDGHVIIALSTGEWYLDEYVKDYADRLQGQGLMNSTGWLLYISTADRKFALTAQDRALKSLTEQRRNEIELIVSGGLERGDIYAAVMDGVQSISALPAPEYVEGEKKMSPDMLIFTGIVVMIIALMLRLRHARKKSFAPEN